MKKNKKVKSNYNSKSLDNLLQNNKNLSTEEKNAIKKDSAKMRTKSYKWRIVINVPEGRENLSILFSENSSRLQKLEGYGFDYYAICHDKDWIIDENNIKKMKTIHYHLILSLCLIF